MTTTSRIRKIAAVLGLACVLALQMTPVRAADDPNQPTPTTFKGALEGGLNQAAPTELKGQPNLNIAVANIIRAAIGLLGVVLLFYFLYGGFLWMTAGGDSKKVDLATAQIKNAVIGLIIITLAYAGSLFVIEKLSTVVGGT